VNFNTGDFADEDQLRVWLMWPARTDATLDFYNIIFIAFDPPYKTTFFFTYIYQRYWKMAPHAILFFSCRKANYFLRSI